MNDAPPTGPAAAGDDPMAGARPSAGPPRTWRRVLVRVGAVCLGVMVAFVCLEVVFRLFDIRPPELPPADQVDAFAVRNEVNGLGLRAPQGYPPPREPGEFRIAVLGDSMTYGEGVEVDQAFPAVMQAGLNESAGDAQTFTVVNMGRLGDDTLGEAERYRGLADRIAPDLLVLVFYVNDFAQVGREPDTALHDIYSIRDDRYLLSELSYVFHYVERTIRLRRAFNETIRYFRADLERGVEPEAFAPVARAIVELRDFAEARGTRFALAMMPWLVRLDDYQLTAMHARIGELCDAEDIPFHDLAPAFAGRDEAAMRVSLANHHPSAAAHRIVAATLAEFLREQELLPAPGRP